MMKVTWLGQAGYLVDINGTVICIDPYLSNIVFEIEKMDRMIEPPVQPQDLRCDLFVSTHDHMDHLDPVTVPQMDRTNTQFAGPKSCLDHFAQLGVEADALVSLGRGETVQFGDITLTGVFAQHTPDSIGVVIGYEGKRVYFVGDSLYSEELGKDIGKIDVLFTCINGKLGNMTCEQAVTLTERLQPRLAIPNHYGMFAANTADPKEFTDAVAKLGIATYVAEPAVAFTLEDLL